MKFELILLQSTLKEMENTSLQQLQREKHVHNFSVKLQKMQKLYGVDFPTHCTLDHAIFLVPLRGGRVTFTLSRGGGAVHPCHPAKNETERMYFERFSRKKSCALGHFWRFMVNLGGFGAETSQWLLGKKPVSRCPGGGVGYARSNWRTLTTISFQKLPKVLWCTSKSKKKNHALNSNILILFLNLCFSFAHC